MIVDIVYYDSLGVCAHFCIHVQSQSTIVVRSQNFQFFSGFQAGKRMRKVCRSRAATKILVQFQEKNFRVRFRKNCEKRSAKKKLVPPWTVIQTGTIPSHQSHVTPTWGDVWACPRPQWRSSGEQLKPSMSAAVFCGQTLASTESTASGQSASSQCLSALPTGPAKERKVCPNFPLFSRPGVPYRKQENSFFFFNGALVFYLFEPNLSCSRFSVQTKLQLISFFFF